MAGVIMPDENILSVPRWLKKQRLSAGISQEQLAVQLCKTQSWIAKVENGRIHADIEDILRYCAALNVDKDQLLQLLDSLYEALRTESMWPGKVINNEGER